MTIRIQRDTRTAPAVARGARVFPIPPPAYYGAAFGAGLLLQNAAPLDMPGRPTTALVGAAVVLAGLTMDLAGVAAVIAHRTTIVPHRPVTKLITSGIYRFSRNPMYTGLAIEPEETYLAERYGSIYDDYRQRVRRWI